MIIKTTISLVSPNIAFVSFVCEDEENEFRLSLGEMQIRRRDPSTGDDFVAAGMRKVHELLLAAADDVASQHNHIAPDNPLSR